MTKVKDLKVVFDRKAYMREWKRKEYHRKKDQMKDKRRKWGAANREHLRKTQQEWRDKNREHWRAYRAKYKEENAGKFRQYDVDKQKRKIERQDAMATRPRPDRCELCGEIGPVVWDHCHKTGIFRGWLCSKCNRFLGWLEHTDGMVSKVGKYLDDFHRGGPYKEALAKLNENRVQLQDSTDSP